MTLDNLRYFAAAAMYQHVGRAARSVAISPSVISSAIASLEEELGCELFERKGRGIELTVRGKALLQECKEILSKVDGLRSALKGEPSALKGRYRLGASHFLSTNLLLKSWADLSKNHPDLVADIYSMNTAHAVGEVLTGTLDLAVCFSPLAHPELREHRLFEGELVFIVRKGHPILKASKNEKLRFLSTEKAIIHKSSRGVESCETHPLFDLLQIQPKIGLYFDDDDTAVEALTKSDQWSFVPDYVVRMRPDKVQVLPGLHKKGAAPYRISALIHRERASEDGLNQLVSLLKS